MTGQKQKEDLKARKERIADSTREELNKSQRSILLY